jgi:hypothetical protein
MDKEKLLSELREEFDRVKASSGFVASFDDFERYCSLTSSVLNDGYIGPKFLLGLSRSLKNCYYNYVGELHSLFMPPQGNLIVQTESTALSEDDRELIKCLINQAMMYHRSFNLLELSSFNDPKAFGSFIDELMSNLPSFLGHVHSLLVKAEGKWSDEFEKRKEKLNKKK